MAISLASLKTGRNGTRSLNALLGVLVAGINAARALGPTLPTYTVAQLPAAAANAGNLVRCSNGSAGAACLVFSDGTNWKVVAIGATASAT